MIRRLWPWLAVAALVLPGIAAVLGVGGLHPLDYVAHPVRSDFALYYRDARVGIEDGWRQMYNPAGFDRVTRQLGIANGDPGVVSLSPPPLIWLVAPFALLPLRVGYMAWVLALMAAALGMWAMAAPGARLRRAAHLVLAVFFTPLLFGLVLGQAALLAALGVVLAWRFLQSDREIPAGVALGLVLLKPQLAFAVPIALLLAGRRRTVAAFATTAALLGAMVLLVLPASALIDYAGRITAAATHPSVWKVSNDLTLMGIQPPLLAVGLSAAVLAATAWTAFQFRTRATKDGHAIVVGLVASLLLAPYLHSQDLAIVLVAGWLSLRAQPPPPQLLLLGVTYLACDLETFGGFGLARAFELAWLAWILVETVRRRRRPATGVPQGGHERPPASQVA